jgi:hypothetical protein
MQFGTMIDEDDDYEDKSKKLVASLKKPKKNTEKNA